jgi:hypothetical protein
MARFVAKDALMKARRDERFVRPGFTWKGREEYVRDGRLASVALQYIAP